MWCDICDTTHGSERPVFYCYTCGVQVCDYAVQLCRDESEHPVCDLEEVEDDGTD